MPAGVNRESEWRGAVAERFSGVDAIAVNAAGCGSHLKEAGLDVRVLDVSELLAEEPRAERHPLALRVAFQDSCHLAHAQGIRVEPRELLDSIPGLERAEPAEQAICCGSAGVYNLTQPEAARELGDRKAQHVLATEPDAYTSANPGCLVQVSAALRRAGRAAAGAPPDRAPRRVDPRRPCSRAPRLLPGASEVDTARLAEPLELVLAAIRRTRGPEPATRSRTVAVTSVSPLSGEARHSRRDVHRDAPRLLASNPLHLARVDAGTDLNAQRRERVLDAKRAANRPCRPVEDGEEAVSGSVDLLARVSGRAPGARAVWCCSTSRDHAESPSCPSRLRRADDVREEDRREDPIGDRRRPGAREELLDLVEKRVGVDPRQRARSRQLDQPRAGDRVCELARPSPH